MADRVRRETEIANVQAAKLAAIRERRHMIAEHDHRRVGLEKALRAEVGLAILNPDPPTDDEVAKAAGWTVEDVGRLRVELLAPPPESTSGD